MDKVTSDNWAFEPYTPGMRGAWDERVASARNSTFLFRRDYMEYHADRFRDASLLAYKRGKLMVMLPADITADGTLRSHGGLTYGGWILPDAHLDGDDVLSLISQWVDYCRANHVRRIDYRPLPHIYHRRPSQEDIYAFWRMGASMSACSLSSVVDYADPGQFNTLQRRHLRKASALPYEIAETADVAPFHAMLSGCLAQRHGASPVHSCSELQMLRDRFPDNIRVFTISLGGELHAGVCMYLTDTVAHTQYIASTPEGRAANALTLLFRHLIDTFAATHRYFDFGTSNEEGGTVLNAGLIRQKFSLGASGVVYPRFILDL